MDTDSDFVENIKACRTCGIHYVTPSKHQLKHLFQSSLDHSEIMLIRMELSQWNVEVAENDGFPQYVCNTCIHKFEQVFELRAACINAQNELRKFYAVPNGNVPNVNIKRELPDPDDEEPICDFVYVDDLSDTEYDGATPFNYPHIPIKEEVIEAATIPMEDSQQPTNIVESASRVAVQKGTSSSHIPEMMSQNKNVTASQLDAVEQITVEKINCKLCQHLSSNPEEHQQHVQLAHETRDFECHICGKEFKNSTSSRLKFHMKWHTLNKHVKCNLCGFVCNSKGALREHKQVNHRKLNCKICQKSILAKKMKSHLRQHELLPKYSCEYCTEAFATENERENHIWQIHANEDNKAVSKSLPTFQASCSQSITGNSFKMPQEEILCQQPQEEILYKFMCAHCEHRFIEQIDLEKHVNEEHRINPQMVAAALEATSFVEDVAMNETAEITHNDHQNVNEHANIQVFEEYDKDNDIQAPDDNDSSLNKTLVLSEDFISPSTSSHFVAETKMMQNDESETVSHILSNGESEDTDSQDETDSNFPLYVESSLNTFACAKCSETFVSIEQLRQHYEQHLAAEQQQNVKAKYTFKCNLCGKTFDLKFSLNRHIKKHKHAPI